MFSNTVMFAVVSLLVGNSEEKIITKNGLAFTVDGDFWYTIDASYIPTLQEGAISDIADVTALILTRDNITMIEPGAFQNLTNLRYLVVNYNDVTRIEVGVFNDLNLTDLDIGLNKISFIASHAFDGMENLERLYSGNNNLSRWDVLWFVRTPSLNFVHMRNNQYEKIPAKPFGIREKADTFYLISLDGNNINEISDDAFEGFRKITVLFLGLEDQALLYGKFLRGIEVEELHVYSKGIRSLPEEIFTKAFMPVKIIKRQSSWLY